MKNNTTLLFILGISSALCSPTVLAESHNPADDQAARVITPYGENPNLAHVLGYKVQEGVIGAAQKVGAATEKGVAKIKPGVDQAWDNTKALTQRGTERVKTGSQQVAENTKALIKPAAGSAPIIEQQSLSQSSSATTTPHQPSTEHSQQVPSSAVSYPITDL